MADKDLHPLIERLINRQRTKQLAVFVQYFTDDAPQAPQPLFNLLMLPKEVLNAEGAELLRYLEEQRENASEAFTFERFKWKIAAFLCLQDVMHSPYYPDMLNKHLLQYKYFYYESKYILTESIVAGLNGLHVANKQLLYGPDDSPKMAGVFSPNVSFESMYWIHASIVLDQVLWMYFVNFPMLFRPVNVLKKFGFNWPSGIFVNASTTSIIKKAITVDDFAAFESYALQNEIIRMNMDFYNSQKDLTEQEIWATYSKEREPSESMEACYVKQLAELRGMMEAAAIVKPFEEKPDEIFNEGLLEGMKSFTAWQELHKATNR